jgi:iron(III) transport system substrate-binding protein
MRIAAALVLIAASWAGPAAAQSAADNPAMYKGPDREQRLIEGAKKEGQVTVYSSMIVDQALRPLVDGFQAKYPL